jgi:hypothetical protein
MDNGGIKWVVCWMTIIDIAILSVFLAVVFNFSDKDDKQITAASSYTASPAIILDGVGEDDVESSEEVENIIEIYETHITHKEDYQGTYDEAIVELYKDMIKGTYYISDNMSYSFGENGVYDGFFDSNNIQVSGYQYDVLKNDDLLILNIYSPEYTAMVTYTMSVNSKGNIVLHYGTGEIYIELNGS